MIINEGIYFTFYVRPIELLGSYALIVYNDYSQVQHWNQGTFQFLIKLKYFIIKWQFLYPMITYFASDKLFKVVDIPANVTISLINKLNKGRKKDN